MNWADRVERLDNFHDLSIEYLKTNMVELSFALRSTSTNFVAIFSYIAKTNASPELLNKTLVSSLRN